MRFLSEGLISTCLLYIVSCLDVEVKLTSGWPGASPASEFLEVFVDLGFSSTYLRALAVSSDDQKSWPQLTVDAAMRLATTDTLRNFTNLSVLYRLGTAKIEAARSLEKAHQGLLSSSCAVGKPWVAIMVGEKPQAACTVKELVALGDVLASNQQPSGPWVTTKIDHVLYDAPSNEGAAVIIGYADIGSAASAPFLKALVELADKLRDAGNPGRVVFRHGASAVPVKELPESMWALAGFGVQLSMRSADERAKAAAGKKQVNATEKCMAQAAGTRDLEFSAGDPAAGLAGLDLSMLSKRHPDAGVGLCALQFDLRQAGAAPLPPWEIKHVGLRATQRIAEPALAGNGQAALDLLSEIASDFPQHAVALSKAPRPKGDQQATFEQVEAFQKSIGADFKRGHLEINGRSIPKSQRGLLLLLRENAPMFAALELLGAEGLNAAAAAIFLRDSVPLPLPNKLALPSTPRPVPFYDVMEDEATQRWYEQPMLLPRFLAMGAQVPQLKVPIATLVFVYTVKHIEEFAAQFQFNHPGRALGIQEGAAPMRIHLVIVKENGEMSPLGKLMQTLLLPEDGEGDDARRNAQTMLEQAEDDTVESAKAIATDLGLEDWDPDTATTQYWKPECPPPCVLVNGQLLMGEDALDFEKVATAFVQRVMELGRTMHMTGGLAGIEGEPSAEEMAAWEMPGAGAPLTSINPALMPHMRSKDKDSEESSYDEFHLSSREYVMLKPGVLKNIPHVSVTPETEIDSVATHLMVLPEPTLTATNLNVIADLIKAYAELMRGKDGVQRWFGIAVAGPTLKETEKIHAAGALRRCFAAALSSDKPIDKLENLATVWQQEGGKVDGDNELDVKKLLATCKDAGAQQDSIWTAKDTALAKTLSAVFEKVSVPISDLNDGYGAMLLLSGRLLGPVSSLVAAHLVTAEKIETDGYELKSTKKDAGSTSESGKKLVLEALHEMGAKDPLVVAYAQAVRGSVISQMSFSSRDDGENVQQSIEKAAPGLRISLPAAPGAPSLMKAIAILDPLSEAGQRLPPLLKLLHEELNVAVEVVMVPDLYATEAPLTSYYRTASISSHGGVLSKRPVAAAKFQGIYPGPGVAVSAKLLMPDSWVATPLDSGDADMDNVVQEEEFSKPKTVRAQYEVSSLFMEGTGLLLDPEREIMTGPAASYQVALSPLGHSGVARYPGSSTVIVKSGYFQLRSPPGVYVLKLHDAPQGAKITRPKPPAMMEATSLAGGEKPLVVFVSGQSIGGKQAMGGMLGMIFGASAFEDEEEPEVDEKTKKAVSTKKYGAGGDLSVCKDTVHIFSVASGLLYERLLRIMMLSVRAKTKCPLHFWLIDNFLSPNFKKTMNALAEKFGFKVDSVTYKWPSWLREQSEKQRVIWAYKILFLDVLFPLDVDRMLFIDADQIVKADVRELWDIKLDGKVYGMVPFCQDKIRNEETMGFRFWEKGFWAQHLGSKPYHISALFVVDLKAFRRMGAGDILRGTYQDLTADPTSLANLDQDLPNYVQPMLPLHSLPAEWLWCESWCSESSKAAAKTIDMCQNPLKKESKLGMAERIGGPEWSAYDKELDTWLKTLK